MLSVDANDDIGDKPPSILHIIPATYPHEAKDNASVSSYFRPTTTPTTLHGHILYPTVHTNLHKCLLFTDADETTQLVAIKKVNVTEWRKERAWDKLEGHIGIMEKYVGVQTALHLQE